MSSSILLDNSPALQCWDLGKTNSASPFRDERNLLPSFPDLAKDHIVPSLKRLGYSRNDRAERFSRNGFCRTGPDYLFRRRLALKGEKFRIPSATTGDGGGGGAGAGR